MITAGDLLQANAIIIGGILILLTISSFRKMKFSRQNLWRGMSAKFAISIVIIPFSVSSIILMTPYLDSAYSELEIMTGASFTAMAGFVYLMLVILNMRLSDDS